MLQKGHEPRFPQLGPIVAAVGRLSPERSAVTRGAVLADCRRSGVPSDDIFLRRSAPAIRLRPIPGPDAHGGDAATHLVHTPVLQSREYSGILNCLHERVADDERRFERARQTL